jgi:protein O-GlcNAcase / histone acetyltransferase
LTTVATRDPDNFLCGVIEGFYGQPWSQVERFELFDWMQGWGLNTYLYAPKDDLKHRTLWRELYSEFETENLEALITACRQRILQFVYALSPGLDIRYGDKAEVTNIQKRFEQLLAPGCEHFALLFDDIPDNLDSADIKQFGSLAAAQCHVANSVFKWIRDQSPKARILFCPTAYCGRMAQRQFGGKDYLVTVGRELADGIDVFWTGPEIISREISVARTQELEAVLRRKPLIWDNLHANDYDGRRFFCGPYSGRALELREHVSGLLINPNTEFPLNYVPLRTFGEFVKGQGTWDPRQAYLAAMREWFPRFATVGEPVLFQDMILFGDCYYLPHEEGPEAEALYDVVRAFVGSVAEKRAPANIKLLRQNISRLRAFCARMADLRDRSLFYALSRRVWELREELDLLEQFVRFKCEGKNDAFRPDSHLPGTNRGGMVARLQRLLFQEPDGEFRPGTGLAELAPPSTS